MRKKYKSKIIKFRSGCKKDDKAKLEKCKRYYNKLERQVDERIIKLELKLKQLRT